MLLPYIEHRWGEVQTNYIIFWHLFENLRIIDVGSRYSYSKWFANLSSKYHRYTPGQKKIAQIALYEVKPDYTQWSRSKLASICALLLRYTEGCVNANQNFAYLINIVQKITLKNLPYKNSKPPCLVMLSTVEVTIIW